MGIRFTKLTNPFDVLADLQQLSKDLVGWELLEEFVDMSSLRTGKKDTKMRIRAFPVRMNILSSLKRSFVSLNVKVVKIYCLIVLEDHRVEKCN